MKVLFSVHVKTSLTLQSFALPSSLAEVVPQFLPADITENPTHIKVRVSFKGHQRSPKYLTSTRQAIMPVNLLMRQLHLCSRCLHYLLNVFLWRGMNHHHLSFSSQL